MRDFLGTHVSQVNEHGSQVDVDEVFVMTSSRGSFRVKYAANVDRVCVEVEGPPFGGSMRMQLTLAQAILLRELLDAGIADTIAATAAVLELPAGGAA